jgi:hypothetical protein
VFWGLLLWILVYGVASLIGFLDTFDITYPVTTGLRRLVLAILYSTLLAALFFGLAFAMRLGWLPETREVALQLGTRIAQITFVTVPVFFAIGCVMVAGFNFWSMFPGGPSPRMKGFVQRHPHLKVHEYIGGGNVGVINEDGTRVEYDERDLADATIHFDKCDSLRMRELGSLPLLPGSTCLVRVWLEQPHAEEEPPESEEDADNETQWVTYVFRISLDDWFAVRQHFEAWLKQSGASESFVGGGRRSWVHTTIGGQKYRITIRYRRRVDAHYDVSVLRK